VQCGARIRSAPTGLALLFETQSQGFAVSPHGRRPVRGVTRPWAIFASPYGRSAETGLPVYAKGPWLKPLLLQVFFQWPEGHCSLRHLACVFPPQFRPCSLRHLVSAFATPFRPCRVRYFVSASLAAEEAGHRFLPHFRLVNEVHVAGVGEDDEF